MPRLPPLLMGNKPCCRVRGTGWGLLLSALAAGAHAAPDCPTLPSPFPESPLVLSALEGQLRSVARQCERDPGFLAGWGAVLNALGRPREAADVLERALLLQPEHMAARFDYAEALAGMGDVAAARALTDDLLARQDLPGTLRPRLLTQRDRWQQTGWLTRRSLTFRAGYDSNLTSASSSDTLTLTLPTGNVNLMIDPRYRPKAGMTLLGELHGEASRRLAAGRGLYLFADMRQRETVPALGADSTQLDASALLTAPLAQGELQTSVNASTLDYGGNALFRSVRGVMAYGRPVAGCQPRAEAEVEWRHYPAVPLLDGVFTGVAGGWVCSSADTLTRFTAMVRLGVDTAESARPGGNQRRADMRLTYTQPLGDGQLEADAYLSRQHDQSGYSPLLDNNAARQITRLSLRAEYLYPLAPHWLLLTRAELNHQHAAQPLFSVKGQAVTVGIRYHW